MGATRADASPVKLLRVPCTPGTSIALISDTHGLLDEDALPWLAQADAVLHAGDIGAGGRVSSKGKRLTAENLLSNLSDRIQPRHGFAAVLGNVDEAEKEALLRNRGMGSLALVELEILDVHGAPEEDSLSFPSDIKATEDCPAPLANDDASRDHGPRGPWRPMLRLLMQHYPPGCKEYPSELVERHNPIDVHVYGHSHKPSVSLVDGALHINPGSAGPKRFKLPRSMATLRFEGGSKWTVAFLGLGDTTTSDLPSPETYDLGGGDGIPTSSTLRSIHDGDNDHDGRSCIEMAPRKSDDDNEAASQQHQNDEPRRSKRRRHHHSSSN